MAARRGSVVGGVPTVPEETPNDEAAVAAGFVEVNWNDQSPVAGTATSPSYSPLPMGVSVVGPT